MKGNICLFCRKILTLEEYKSYHGIHKDCFYRAFHLSSWRDSENLALKNQGSDSASTSKDDSQRYRNFTSSFFQGQFKKYTAELNGKEYILKVQEKEAPELPDNEYLCNQIAQSLGLNVPNFFLIDFYGVLTFVVENFMTKVAHPVSLNHIYHYLKEDSHYSCKELLEIIQKETGDFHYQESFVQMCLFDSLIGNHDRHGRNLGFLNFPKKTILAPIYDNPSFLGLQSGSILQAQFNPKGKIRTEKTDEPGMVDYVVEFFDRGFEASVKEFFKKIKISKIQNLMEESFCSVNMKKAFQRLFTQRYEELRNALSH
jgi:hypothetical protein